ncbi:MAG: hypothetical protein ACVCEJ_07050 [Candidatus Izemoplasmataceae bacterium]
MKKVEGLSIKEEHIKLHFEGDQGIDIDTLVASLEYTKTTLKSSKKFLTSVDNYEIIVQPFKEGSFVIDITLLVSLAAELLPAAKTMGEIFIETIKIWKFLKGEPAKEIIHNKTENKIEIIGDNNSVLIVQPESLSTLNDTKKIAEDFSNISKKMLKDSTNRGNLQYSVRNENGIEQESYSQQDIRNTKSVVYLSESSVKKSVSTSHILLSPIIVNFNKPTDWKFSSPLSDKPIKADIEDLDFKTKVEKGEIQFGNDTQLDVVLQTTEIEYIDGSSKKKYEHCIKQVVDIIYPDKNEQTHIDEYQ